MTHTKDCLNIFWEVLGDREQAWKYGMKLQQLRVRKDDYKNLMLTFKKARWNISIVLQA